MIDIYTIASKPQHIMDHCQIHKSFKYNATYQARPGMYLPILIRDNEVSKLVMATWGIESTARHKDPVNSISTDRILRTPPFNMLMQIQRCAILTNCFFAEYKSEVYLIRLIRPRLFCIGGIYIKEGDEYRFAMLKTASADILAELMDDMPLVFTPERLHIWLQSEHLLTIMDFTSKAGGHWFDFFKVNSGILSPGSNTKGLLRPLGMSLQQMNERRDKLNSLAFEGERANRKSMKH